MVKNVTYLLTTILMLSNFNNGLQAKEKRVSARNNVDHVNLLNNTIVARQKKLHGPNGNLDYEVFEYQNKGYKIVKLSDNSIVEYTLTSINPYKDYMEKDYLTYAGPTEYYYKDGNLYRHTILNHTITSEDLSKYVEESTVSVLQSTSSNNATTQSLSDNHFVKTVKYNSYDVIANYKYFTNVKNYGRDDGNDCGYVSMLLLTSYYDVLYNDNVIDNRYNIFTTQQFTSMPTSLGDFESQPAADFDYLQKIKAIGVAEGLSTTTNYGLNGIAYPRLFTAIMKDRGYYDNTHYRMSYIEGNLWDEITGNARNRATEQILLGMPQIFNFRLTSSSNHSAIGYGVDSNYFLVNYGWGSDFNEMFVAKTSVISTFGLAEFKLIYEPSCKAFYYGDYEIDPIVELHTSAPEASDITFTSLS